jgi:bis(5'-nucleosyl)-tetraphosphatase (symmetrical)
VATWVVGDVHGHREALATLLERLELDPVRDELWLVGDLVNRGPRSLAVLRWARERQAAMGERFVVTLGNHDLHLLALSVGAARPRAEDRLDEVLAAADAAELIEWLAARPLLHRRDGWLLVHAGLLPSWTEEEAERRARALEAALRDPGRRGELLAWPAPERVEPDLAERRRDLAAFSRLRALTRDERPCRHTGPPEDAPAGCRPWFDWPHARRPSTTIVFGHWAALGLLVRPDAIALDTGAAWGGSLTAVRLEDRRIVSLEVR